MLSRLRTKAIMVTGGCGFIGSHVCISLLDEGFDVVAVDLEADSIGISGGSLTSSGRSYRRYKLDVCNYEELTSIIAIHDVSAVIHLAADKSVSESTRNPEKYFANNLEATKSLIKCINRNSRIQAVIFSSSASVYGFPHNIPVSEVTPVAPANPYAWSKYFCEIMLETSLSPQISVITLRYFNPVGFDPRAQRFATNSACLGESLFEAIIKIIQGQHRVLDVFSTNGSTPDNSGIRDYIHVSDVARAHVICLKEIDKIKTNREIFNIGLGAGFSVYDVVSEFEKISGRSIPINEAANRSWEVPEIFADISKFRDILNWTACYGLPEMCKSAYEHWVRC